MNVENELDIRGLFRALWAGKGWIVGIAVLFRTDRSYLFLLLARVERDGNYRPADRQYAGRILFATAVLT